MEVNKTLVLSKFQSLLALEERPIPVPTGSEVVVKVVAAGLCHSDVHLWEGRWHSQAPNISLGHEISGSIFSTGPQASIPCGTRVVVYPWIGCSLDSCRYCSTGNEHHCLVKHKIIGFAVNGGLQQYCLVPHERYCVGIGSLEFQQACVLACAGLTAFSAVSKFGHGVACNQVGIIGVGGLGLAAISVLKALDAKGAIAIDISDSKLDLARCSGALKTFNSKHSGPDAFKAEFGTLMLLLDFVGSSESLSFGFEILSQQGHYVLCGLFGGDISQKAPTFASRGLKLEGSPVGSLEELKVLVQLAEGKRLPPMPLALRKFPQECYSTILELKLGLISGRAVFTDF